MGTRDSPNTEDCDQPMPGIKVIAESLREALHIARERRKATLAYLIEMALIEAIEGPPD